MGGNKPVETDFKIAWFATKGSGTNEAKRIQTLLSRFGSAVELPFSKSAKFTSLKNLLLVIKREKPALLVMEGTGIGQADWHACFPRRFGISPML